jgi:hypothetical protein
MMITAIGSPRDDKNGLVSCRVPYQKRAIFTHGIKQLVGTFASHFSVKPTAHTMRAGRRQTHTSFL